MSEKKEDKKKKKQSVLEKEIFSIMEKSMKTALDAAVDDLLKDWNKEIKIKLCVMEATLPQILCLLEQLLSALRGVFLVGNQVRGLAVQERTELCKVVHGNIALRSQRLQNAFGEQLFLPQPIGVVAVSLQFCDNVKLVNDWHN